MTIANCYESDYGDFSLFVEDFQKESKAWVYDKGLHIIYKAQIVEIIDTTNSEISEEDIIYAGEDDYDYSGEFIEDCGSYYLKLKCVQ